MSTPASLFTANSEQHRKKTRERAYYYLLPLADKPWFLLLGGIGCLFQSDMVRM